MLDRLAPPLNDLASRLAASDLGRVLGIAAVVAGTRAADPAKYPSVLRQAMEHAPSVKLLPRSPDAALDPDQSRELVDVSASLIEVLAPLSPAAWLIRAGSYVRLGRYDARPSAVHRVGRLVIRQYELKVPVKVDRGVLESRDVAWLARLLLEATAHRLDAAMLSSKPDPHGLLHDICPVVENVDGVMLRDLERLRAKLGARDAVIVAAAPQAAALNRGGTKYNATQRVNATRCVLALDGVRGSSMLRRFVEHADVDYTVATMLSAARCSTSF
jgi:hypothetical protein